MKTPKSTRSSHSKSKSQTANTSNKPKHKNIIQQYISTHKLPPLISLEKKIFKDFNFLYSNDANFYNVKVINEIICNESSHIVALFKDYLITGDYSEFLQGTYTKSECLDILPKIYDYYESCSVIFPNYIILPESKYIYKNIQRKQRVIDNQQELEQEQEEKKEKKDYTNYDNSESKVFDTQAVDSILNQTDTSTIKKMMQCVDDNETDDYNKVLKMINRAEEERKEKTERKIVNCTLRIRHNNKNNKKKANDSKSKNSSNINVNLSHVIKGRNYNRIMSTNMSSLNKVSSTTERGNTKTSIKNKEIQTVSDNKRYYHKHNNSHNIKEGIIHSLLSSNFDLIRKTFKDITKRSCNRNKINPVTSPNNHKSKSKENTLLSSPRYNSRSTISMKRLSNQISEFINKINKQKSKHSKDNERPPKQDYLFISHNGPLTARDVRKSSMNQEIINFLEPKQIHLKQHIKNSMSISHKKTFTSSSLGTATGSLNNNQQQNEDKLPNKQSMKGSITHRNERCSLNYNFTGDLTKLNSQSKVKSTFNASNNKVLKTYTHVQSNSTLIGNEKNIVIPVRRELNIKGIKIKGFDELLSRNYYANKSNSDRSGINKAKKSKEKKNNIPYTKGYIDFFKKSKT